MRVAEISSFGEEGVGMSTIAQVSVLKNLT